MMFRALLFSVAALAACSPTAEKAPEAPAPAELGAVAVDNVARVTAPLPNATVTSPLHVTGVAPANWYFENQFPVQLLDAQGQVIAQAPATPRVNWTENAEPKEFDATLTFAATGPATLVLQEDMPREDAAPREARISVVLAAR